MKTKCIGCDGIPAANRFVVGANVKEEIRFNITILIQIIVCVLGVLMML